ncbi:hypothetical protein [Erysipelothrix rhusiopathiae]|uniref:hypothetical protein n=1 Tax=Erysipelothrix rhusiopathiae TaxID=1648 RepID=UPI002480E892|nr:hypothetical protein [Erysipelothrix rhusiopathiae]
MSLTTLLNISKESNFISTISQEDEMIKKLLIYEEEIKTDLEIIQNYLLYQSYLKYENDSLFASGEELKRFNKINRVLNRLCSLEIGERNALINKYYRELIEEFSFCKNEIILIAQNNGIDQVVREYIFNFCYKDLIITRNFNLYVSYLKGNTDILKKWFERIIDENMYYINSSVINNLQLLKSPQFKEALEIFVKTVTVDFSKKVHSDLTGTEEDQIFYQYDKFYNEWLEYLKKSKSSEVYKFESLKKIISPKFDKVLETYGTFYDDKYDSSEIINSLKREITKQGIILYEYTHRVKERDSIFSILEDMELSVFDSILSNNPNSFFTHSRLMQLRHLMFNLTNITQHIVYNEPDLLISSLSSYVKLIDSEYSINDDYSLEADFETLFDIIKNISQKKDGTTLNQKISIANYYGPTMYICSLIEKILRNYYKFERREIDFTENRSITLNYLLSDRNKEIKKILGECQMKVMRYYLLSDESEEGLNIRNDLAHLNYNHEVESFYNKFLVSTFLFFSVISSLVLNSMDDNVV